MDNVKLKKTYLAQLAMWAFLLLQAGFNLVRVKAWWSSGEGPEGIGWLTSHHEAHLLASYLFSAIALGFIIYIRREFVRGKMKMRTDRLQMGSANYEYEPLMVSLITYALCEAVSLYGLLLYIHGGDMTEFYVFTAISIALFVMFIPRPSTLRIWAANKGIL